MEQYFGKHTTKVQQLADKLEKDITTGYYEEGDNLPSINELRQNECVSRDTVFKAFALLREKGLIDSTPGKGYYVTNRRKKVLLLLDEYSPFKATLYNSFVKSLPKSYQVDLWFHQYNEKLFNTILREVNGKYHYYAVMNFDNEKYSPALSKIPASKLLLLDFGRFKKEDYSYICQDFDNGLYDALMQLKDRFKHYENNVFYFPKGIKHPHISCQSFLRFCKDNHQHGFIIESEEELEVKPGYAYLIIRQTDVVEVIKRSRQMGLQCGKDFGIVAYNDTPAYEVIDNGITALTVDWEKMGKMAARYILKGENIQQVIPTEIHLRNSL